MEKLDFKIDNRSTVLEYLQIARQIKRSIVNQTLLESHIKTPKTFSKNYDVDLKIVEQAFNELVKEHVFKIDSNNNYYNAYEQRLFFTPEGVSSVDFIKSISLTPSVKIMSEEVIAINEENSLKTSFPLNTQVIKQERIFYGDDIPIICATLYYKKADEKIYSDHYRSMKESLKLKYLKIGTIRNITSTTLPNNINKILNQPANMIGTVIKEILSGDDEVVYYGEFYYNRYYTIRIEF